MHTEKMLSSELKFKGNIINAYTDTVELENGKCATRDVVRHKGAVCVAPITHDGQFVFVRQFRYPILCELLELPAGKYDSADEDPVDCCHRELEEETGMKARTLVDLGSFLPSPGFCDEKIRLFLAENLYNGQANPDDDEFLDVILIPIDKAVEMVMSGEITDGKTQALVLKAANYIKSR